MKTKCEDHTYGVEWGGEESEYTGSLLSKEELAKLQRTTQRTNSSGETTYEAFKFCPECGSRLITPPVKP